MIRLVTRNFIFKNFTAITSEINEIQTSMFDDDPEYFLEDDDRQWYYDMYDAVDVKPEKIKKYYDVVSFDHPEIATFTPELGNKVINLLIQLGIEEVIMIGHIKLDFIGSPENKYKPLQKAIKSFVRLTGDIKYNEALIANMSSLPALIDIAFWLGRCDCSCPEYIYFADVKDRIAFYLCKSGGMHIIQFDCDIVSDEIIEGLDMYFVKGGCEERFSGSSKIEGRMSKKY
ncbi:MAG: hypothetical protein V4594_05235 [Bacteroidota bacterium]